MKRVLLAFVFLAALAVAAWGNEFDDLQTHMKTINDEVENRRIIYDKSSSEVPDDESEEIEEEDLKNLSTAELNEQLARLKASLEALENRKVLNFYLALMQDLKTKAVAPRLIVGFLHKDWVFFDRVTININGNVERLQFPNYRIFRDTSAAGGIREEIELDALQYETLTKQIADSTKTLIRFSGKKQIDFEITKEQKAALKRVWRLYELMKTENEK